MRCTTYCTASMYQLTEMAAAFKKQRLNYAFYRDVLHVPVQTPLGTGDIFYFAEGCIVIWGLQKKAAYALLEQVKNFAVEPLAKRERDQFAYFHREETSLESHPYFNVDIIYLPKDDIEIKLALSYGLARSAKIRTYERAIQKVIAKNSHLPEDLAKHGRIHLSRKAIAQHLGEIFLERSHVNLKTEYLSVPEYFWKHPGLEKYYNLSERYLDIPKRVMILNQKLDVLNETFNILAGQLQHQHSNFLEVIIIILITVEIILNLWHFVA